MQASSISVNLIVYQSHCVLKDPISFVSSMCSLALMFFLPPVPMDSLSSGEGLVSGHILFRVECFKSSILCIFSGCAFPHLFPSEAKRCFFDDD